jgi:hypothetical protein
MAAITVRIFTLFDDSVAARGRRQNGGVPQQAATARPLAHLHAIFLSEKEMHRVHRSAVLRSTLPRVRERDMRADAGGFGFPVSAESAISWRVRSNAEHGWSALGHLANPKTQIPSS